MLTARDRAHPVYALSDVPDEAWWGIRDHVDRICVKGTPIRVIITGVLERMSLTVSSDQTGDDYVIVSLMRRSDCDAVAALDRYRWPRNSKSSSLCLVISY